MVARQYQLVPFGLHVLQGGKHGVHVILPREDGMGIGSQHVRIYGVYGLYFDIVAVSRVDDFKAYAAHGVGARFEGGVYGRYLPVEAGAERLSQLLGECLGGAVSLDRKSVV